jgi:regulator of protease activity HflC (stomatin/prohibitin superfamily)
MRGRKLLSSRDGADRHDGVKDERFPQFRAVAKWRQHEIGSPTRRLRRSLPRSLTPSSLLAVRARLSRTRGDETMTISIESHIEELRAELRNAWRSSRARSRSSAELELAEAELALAIAEQSGKVDAEPPF